MFVLRLESRYTIPTSKHFRIDIFKSSRYMTEQDRTGRDRTDDMWNGSFQGEEVERKISQISSHRTTRFTVFRRTKRRTERLIPFRPVPSHVPNAFALKKWLSSPSGVGQHVPILVFWEYWDRGMSPYM
ncbi:hypothetical protein DVH24_002780 [Malus domestica]|uniref:Uncharacterized protein n=1 Tax=Malus domestica TaxID=3750 RepID=A0A498KB58_MALDO|nr:hypothetical protein DVH24_002780 [Malus domestica]